jgi:3-hydroxybutyryl-CoA dehydrogenase
MLRVENVKKVAVFGAGTMGPGLALVFALRGHDVWLYSRKMETLDKAIATAREALTTLVDHGTITLAAANVALARVHPTRSMEEAGNNADFVMESITENKQAKSALYAQLDAISPRRAVFASNTSSLNIFELMPQNRQPHTIVAHFFAPAHIIPLAEVVPGPRTAVDTIAFTADFLESVGKTPVIMKKFGPGFIVNRIQRAIGETCMDMVQEGLVEPEEIDQAIKATLGIRLPIVGVMQTFDFQGLDTLFAYQKNVGKVYEFVEERVERGELGVKSGRGIYDYQKRSETEILRRRDELYLKMIDYLTEIGAFQPV